MLRIKLYNKLNNNCHQFHDMNNENKLILVQEMSFGDTVNDLSTNTDFPTLWIWQM